MDPAHEFASVRRTHGISVRALSRISGLAPSTITRIERGEVDPTIGTMVKLLQACKCGLQVVEGVPMASRTLRGMLAVAESIERHRDEIVELVTAAGGRDVRRVTTDSEGFEEDADDVAILLVKLPDPFPMSAEAPLVRELSHLLGCDVLLLDDRDSNQYSAGARVGAVSLEREDAAASSESEGAGDPAG